MGLVRNIQSGNIRPQFHLLFDECFETVHTGYYQEPQFCPELITFQSFKSVYDDEDYFPNLVDEWLEPESLEVIRYQGAHMYPKIPVQEEEWPHDPGDQDLRHILNYQPDPTTISEPVPRESPPRESM